MKHKIYDRILYDTYIKLNTGLDSLHDNWGYGCPLGMSPITFEEMEYDRNKWNVKKFNKLRNISLFRVLFKKLDAKEDLDLVCRLSIDLVRWAYMPPVHQQAMKFARNWALN